MQFIILATAVAGGLGSSAANLDAAKAWPAYGGITANLHTGGNNGNALRLRVKTGTGGLHPVPGSTHWERTRGARVRAIDGMGSLVWIVDVGEGQNGVTVKVEEKVPPSGLVVGKLMVPVSLWVASETAT